MDPAAVLKRKRKSRSRFKAAIRIVLMNKYWLSKQEEEPLSFNVKKNLAVITRRGRNVGLLTLAEKSLFSKVFWLRTTEERKRLLRLVLNLQCFAAYSPKIRSRMAKHLRFIYVNVGRTLIREGDEPATVYFILNGELVATKNVYDQITDSIIEKVIHVSGPGDTLGLYALVEGERRPYSHKVRRDIEALALDRKYVEEIILPTVIMEWNNKKEAINKFEYFNHWNVIQRAIACQHSKILEFKPMETIYHEDTGNLGYVYFILSGQCMILQALKLKCTKLHNDQKVYKLCSPDDCLSLTNLPLKASTNETKLNQQNKLITKGEEIKSVIRFDLSKEKVKKSEPKKAETVIENHFIDVGTLKFGAFFGIGESIDQRAIMARTVVQCFLLPRFWLLEKDQNPGNMWQRMKFLLNSTIPSRDVLFKDFVATQKWQHFKKNLILNSLDKTRIGNPTKIEDIPIICRIIESNFEDE